VIRVGRDPLNLSRAKKNIAGRGQAGEGSQGNEAELRFVIDSVLAFVVYCDKERRYRFANKGYAERFGLISRPFE
jgi:PAS domain-containing protein